LAFNCRSDKKTKREMNLYLKGSDCIAQHTQGLKKATLKRESQRFDCVHREAERALDFLIRATWLSITEVIRIKENQKRNQLVSQRICLDCKAHARIKKRQH
jgi:hypothetical protein